MKDLALQLLKSKRTWIALITLAIHTAHHFFPQLQVSNSSIDGIADQALIALGALAVIGTKVKDSQPKAQNAATAAEGK